MNRPSYVLCGLREERFLEGTASVDRMTSATVVTAVLFLAALSPVSGQRPCQWPRCGSPPIQTAVHPSDVDRPVMEATMPVYPSQHEARSHCSYPCRCGPEKSENEEHSDRRCPEDVPLIRDGCGCCFVCAGQLGDSCDGTKLCDEEKGLVCQYRGVEPTGVCTALKGRPCKVHNETYDNGETFLLDCRTQCACQNGTYACSSLCPQESFPPRGFSCPHPRLVEIQGQCCREWMCDSVPEEKPPECPQSGSPWTPCSSACGAGLSQRENVSQLPGCGPPNETRLCQLRPCNAPNGVPPTSLHVRRGHECKATMRHGGGPNGGLRARVGPCISTRRFHPRYCGNCSSQGLCCRPRLSSSMQVEFQCSKAVPSDLQNIAELGTDLWVTEASLPASLREPLERISSDDDENEIEDNAEEEQRILEAEEQAEEAIQGENEEGHRFSRGHFWRVFGVKKKRNNEIKTVVFTVQWVTKCECTRCDITGPFNDMVLHRVHRTTVS